MEVLKGPASILFGAVQPGGLVNMVSKRPRAELFGELGLTVGNYGFRQMTVDLCTPLGEAVLIDDQSPYKSPVVIIRRLSG